jgi:precorrin-8X/cobalt-precorrin-8 methylmutase
LPEFRLVERRARGLQPVWKLYAPGAVGSQTLLGIPRVLGLREHPWLKDHLRVWPFETGLTRLERPDPGSIIAVEIYPSLIAADPAPVVKDAGQVAALARHFVHLDDQGRLCDLFAGDPGLDPAERHVVETEEGWILGVTGKTTSGAGLRAGEAGNAVTGAGATEGVVIRDPAEIYRRSFAIIRREADLSRFSGAMERLAVRVVHACGMPDIAAQLAFSSGAAEAGCRALADGKPILVDAQMVAHGIIRQRLPAANAVICRLDDDRVAALAEAGATTRSAAAVRLWRDHLAGAVVAIGNAPTALFELLDLIADGAPRPALVLGFPVGFVGAAESKDALIVSGLPFIALPGRRGGSAMAAAAVNALSGETS